MAELKPRSEKKLALIEQLRDPLVIETIRRVLPAPMTPERFIIIVQTEVRRIPELAECTNTLAAFFQAAYLGLEPGVMGECWILPYKDTAVFIPGYQGLAQLTWRSGLVKDISARAVFEGDEFEWGYGTKASIHHRPRGENDPKKITHAYTIVNTVMGGTIFDVMSREDIERIRSRSRAKDKGPWVTDYAEMCKKTPFRRLMKIAPKSVQMRTALALDDQADSGEPQSFDVPLPATLMDPRNRIEVTSTSSGDEVPMRKPSEDTVKLTLVNTIRTHMERIPEGLNRTLAMRDLFGSTEWAGLESLSLKEIQALADGGSVTRIVDEALAKAAPKEAAGQ